MVGNAAAHRFLSVDYAVCQQNAGRDKKRLLFVLKSAERSMWNCECQDSGWLPAKPLRVLPSVCGPARQHPACLWARRPGGRPSVSLGVEGHGVGGWAALFKQLELGDSSG